jgi:nucleotide-binding universal stress UspA family protein
MYQRIVVPLDGSKLAEHILPTVQQMAMGLNASVLLVDVVDRDTVSPFKPGDTGMLTGILTGRLSIRLSSTSSASVASSGYQKSGSDAW